MGHSRDEKKASHERIVAITAARIRESGTAQPGVAEIMNAAGLTHGGFYKHFGSRDELIAEAVQRALTDSQQLIDQIAATAADDTLAAFLDAYLAQAHRDDPATGCGVAALSSDISRLGEVPREAYRAQVERYLDTLQELIGEGERARRQAAATLSAMVGAVIIARALGPTEISDGLLRDVRTTLLERAANDGTGL